MARARNIKPAFFDNDELAEIDPIGRLLFIGLWTIADFKGDIVWREKRIKAQLLPYDNCNIKKLAINLDKSGFIRFYSDSENIYLNIANFSKHQNPHKNEREKGSDIPAYSKNMRQVIDLNTLTINRDKSGLIQEDSTCNRADSLNLIPDSLLPITDARVQDKPVADAHKFSFKNELLSLGVNADILNDWLAVRKKKKASNTKTALKGLLTEISKSGLSVNDAIEHSAKMSWSGFKADWYLKELRYNPTDNILEQSANSDWHLVEDKGF